MSAAPERLFFVADIARKLGWSTKRTREWMIQSGIANVLPNRHRCKYYTTRSQLLAILPAVYGEIFSTSDDD